MFSYKFYKIYNNAFFVTTPLVGASAIIDNNLITLKNERKDEFWCSLTTDKRLFQASKGALNFFCQ